MKQLLRLGVCALITLPFLSACGGGGGTPSPTTIAGGWRKVAIGQPGQVQSQLVTCPNFISVGGARVECQDVDRAVFGASGDMNFDLEDPISGNGARIYGTYSETLNRVIISPTYVGIDYNRNNVIETEETYTPDEGIRLTANVREISEDELLMEITFNGVTHTALFVRTE